MEIYVEYGFSKETTVNVVKPGKSGAEEIKAMMDNFRANPPKEIRPSGTEPKIKFYIEVKGEMGCPKCYTSADAEAEKKVEAVRKSLGI